MPLICSVLHAAGALKPAVIDTMAIPTTGRLNLQFVSTFRGMWYKAQKLYAVMHKAQVAYRNRLWR